MAFCGNCGHEIPPGTEEVVYRRGRTYSEKTTLCQQCFKGTIIVGGRSDG